MSKIRRFSAAFQKHVAACFIRLPEFAARFQGLLGPQYFDDPDLSAIVQYANQVYSTTRTLPTKSTLQQFGREESADILKRLYKEDLRDVATVEEGVAEFCRTQAVRIAIVESAEAADSGDMGGIIPKMESALQVGLDTAELGLFFKGKDNEALNKRLEIYRTGKGLSDQQKRVTTGLDHLDEAMNGGLCAGELGVILAPPKRGKSITLINITVGVMSQSKNVVYYSLEMSDFKVLRRLDYRMAMQGLDVLKQLPKKFSRRLGKMAAGHPGDVLVKSYPTRTCTASMLRSHLSRVIGQGFNPSAVIVDYGDIMAPERRIGGEHRHEIAGQFEDLRKLAGEFQIPVWTASQANRGALSKTTVRMEDISEAFEKVAIADAVISLCQTDQESLDGKMRLFLAALREAQQYKTISCKVDFDKAFIRTVGEVATDLEEHGKGQHVRRDGSDDAKANRMSAHVDAEANNIKFKRKSQGK